MTLSHTSSTIVATSQRAQSLFETKSQRTQRTTRYNLSVDSQIKHALHHRTARHPTDFFVIPFIFFCYNLFVCCDRLLIIGCKATQFSRHHQTFSHFFFWIKHFLPLLDPIHHAVGLAVALELAFGAVEEVTYFNIGTFVLGIGALEHLF